MRIIVIGGVAAGTSAAAKARRNSESAEIVIYEKDSFMSYAGCGMPYYLGGVVKNPLMLTPRGGDFFKQYYNIDVFLRHEVLRINPAQKTVSVKNLETGRIFEDGYDKLIIATGAKPVIPPIKGIDRPNVFLLRNINDLNKIADFINDNLPKRAAVIGAGYIGLEVCENLKLAGIKATLIERMPQVLPTFDADMAAYIAAHLKSNGVDVILGAAAKEINDSEVILDNGQVVSAEMVIVSVGVRPDIAIAAEAGIALGVTGGIKVNANMRTSAPDIYACGDCIEQFHTVTGKPVWRPLGSTANKTGRIAGDHATGGDLEFKGVLGTAILKVFDMTAAQTGLTQKEAESLGYDVEVIHNIKSNKPDYMGGKEMTIKAVARKSDARILGAQIVGYEGVDKRIDVFAAAITLGATAEDLMHLDLAYAPPFSIAKDPVNYTGMILTNALKKGLNIITPEQFERLLADNDKAQLIDTRAPHQYERGHIDKAINIPLEKLRDDDSLDKDAPTVVYCTRAVTANAAQNILLNKGFTKVYNLSGGYKHYKASKRRD